MLSLLFASLGLLFCLQLWRKLQARSANLPPGPKPLPIVGNVRDTPPADVPEYQHWLKFKDAYGPISSVSVLGQPLILLHDHDAARELLNKKTIQSRPWFPFADLCGFGQLLNLLSFTPEYRVHRQMIHQQFGTKVVAERFKEAETMESHRLLVRLLEEPDNLLDHIKAEASAIILRITYGYSISPTARDPLVDLIEKTMDVFGRASDLLAWPVNSLPFLRHVPEGLPGTSFKKTARDWSKLVDAMLNVPYAFVQKEMAQGTHRPSYVSRLLEQARDEQGQAVELDAARAGVIKKTAAVMYGGGSDTTVASLHAFILAMLQFPAAQRQAQQELDAVVGGDRLPRFSDRDQLPFVNALVHEVFRWHPVAPLAVPHRADSETHYAGFRIPRGAYLIPSLWWFLHDPAVYADPGVFDPARYLAPRGEPDPTGASFGFGRRICPGRYVADQTLFITVARVLAVFDIAKAVDGAGRERAPQKVGTSGLIMRLHEFPYCIKPRSERCVQLIRAFEAEYPEENLASEL